MECSFFNEWPVHSYSETINHIFWDYHTGKETVAVISMFILISNFVLCLFQVIQCFLIFVPTCLFIVKIYNSLDEMLFKVFFFFKFFKFITSHQLTNSPNSRYCFC